MAPILIDRRRLVKLSLLLSGSMLALFFSGYFIGFHKAEALMTAGMQTRSLDLPDATRVALDETAYIPTVIEPGLDRDVDAPDAPDEVATDAAHLAKPVAVDNTANNSKTSQQASAPAVETVGAPAADEVQTQTVAVGGPPEQEEDRLALLADTAEEELAKYTIQVGLFSTSDNAERKVEDLLAQRLSAYSTEYTNKNNRRMYNVRFGYYDTYRSAKTALKIYQSELSGDGYIVKLKK